MRTPVYFAAGMLRSNAWLFALYFLIAATVWTPLLVGGAALLGEQALRQFVDRGLVPAVAVFIAAVAIFRIVRHQFARVR